MLRLFAIVLASMFAISASAAPVPEQRLTPEKLAEFEKLWLSADGNGNSAEEVRLVARLLAEPKLAPEFLKGKLFPLQLTVKEAKQLLARLGSDDESVWQTAYRELHKRDIRLALTLPEAWDETKSEVQRRRLAGVTSYWGGRCDTPQQWAEEFKRIAKTGDFTLSPPRFGSTTWSLVCRDENFTSISPAPIDLAGWEKANPHAFDRPRVGLMLRTLEQIGSPAAKALIESMAEGNPEAHLTKVAAAAHKRLKVPPTAAPDSRMIAGLRMLRYWQQPVATEVDPAELANFLTHPEQAVAFFQARLKPLQLTRKEGEAILARLFSDDPKVWRSALRELRTVDIRLAMPMTDAWAMAKTADHRCRLMHAQQFWDVEIGDDFKLPERYRFVDYEYRDWPVELGRVTGWHTTEIKRPNIPDEELPKGLRLYGVSPLGNTLRDNSTWRWDREKSAIFILEAIGSEPAFTLIREIAKGNPEASLTQVAKSVLKQRK